MDDVNNLAETAAKLTFIFKKTVTNRFKNIFNESTEIASTENVRQWKDLVPLYVNWITENKESIQVLPSEGDESKKYFELAFKWANMSLDKKSKRFVDPILGHINQLQKLQDFYRNSYKSHVYKIINEAKENGDSLPALPNGEEEWQATFTEIYEKDKTPKPIEVKEEPIPANYAVSVESNDEEMFEASKDNLRYKGQKLRSNLPMQIKIYDVIKMRDYLRTLRRLWNLSQLHNGKEKNIMIFDKDGKVSNHPYFRTHPNKFNIYERISDSLIKSFPPR